MRSAQQWAAFNIERNMEERVACRQDGAAILNKSKPYEIVAGHGKRRLTRWGNAHDASLSVQACRHVKVSVDVERHALGAAKSLIEDRDIAVTVDSVNGLVG